MACRYWDDGTTTKYEQGAHGAQNFSFHYAAGTATSPATLDCSIAAMSSEHGYAPPAGEHTHVIELRGFAAGTPTKVQFNGVPGSIEVVRLHSLARPRGTVLLKPPAPVTLATAVTVTVSFGSEIRHFG